MNYTRNLPLYFKKQFNQHPNAVFLRDLGIVNAIPVCEILFQEATWIVRGSEIQSEAEALAKWITEFKAKLAAAKKEIGGEKQTKVAIAKILKISTATLRKRMKVLEEI